MRKCDKERITDAIDEAFKDLHLTKVQLADRTGKTRHYYNNYLVGNLAPNEEVVKLLGDNLKIPYPVVRECLSYRRERYVKQHRKHAVVSKDVHNGINDGVTCYDVDDEEKARAIQNGAREFITKASDDSKIEHKCDVAGKDISITVTEPKTKTESRKRKTFGTSYKTPIGKEKPGTGHFVWGNEGIDHNDLMYDQYVHELCENINISDMKKLLYGSSLTPTEYMEIWRALSGNGVATSSTYDNTHVIYIDEGLLKKAIIAAIKKVSQEMKETDKEG